jgi:(+)-trans-carveol dehydrogenase
MGKFTGKVALITGGARGQGRSHAVHLAQEGADIVLADICADIPGVKYPGATHADLDETVALVEKLDRRCLAYVADARDGERMHEVVDAAVAELGRLDTVVVNHGIGGPHPSDDPSGFAMWDTVIDTNLSAVFKTAAVCVPHLRAAGGGTITVTGSAASFTPLYNNAAYTAAKHGLIGLVKALAADLADDWIRVNAVCPSSVETPLFVNDFNIGRFVPEKENPTVADMEKKARALNQLPVSWLQPDAISKAILFLASDDAAYVTGVALPVDAGMTTQPPGVTKFIGQMLWEAANPS